MKCLRDSKLQFLGHAGLLVDTEVKLLCDPWFTSNGAMLGTWKQFPPNSALLEQIRELKQPDYVWISHEHSDHFDIEFLSSLPKSTQFIIPKFLTTNIEDHLRSNGFDRFIYLGDKQELRLCENTQIEMIFEIPIWAEHSSLVIKSHDFCLLHNSDSFLDSSQLRYIKDKYSPEYYIGQYSSTSPYPDFMTSLTNQEKKPLRRRHLDWAMQRFSESARNVGAKTAIPCAGPAVLVNKNRIKDTFRKLYSTDGCMNFDVLFKKLKTSNPGVKIKYLEPGDTLDSEGSKPPKYSSNIGEVKKILKASNSTESMRVDEVDFNKILEKHRIKMKFAAPHITASLKACFSVHFPDKGAWIDTKFSTDQKTGLAIVNVSGAVDVSQRNIHGEFYQIEVESRIWNLFVKDEIVFDEIFYSQRQTISESSFGYSSDLINLLRTCHSKVLLEAANASMLEANSEKTEIEYDGKLFSISKFCPHMGVSLEGVVPNADGTITCPAHKWKFCLKTGNCISHDRTKSIR